MTTRNPTGLFARAQKDYDSARSLNDRLYVTFYGAIGWPWLLKSLYGGSKADKARLLARLALPDDALPHLGSWKADTHLLHLSVDMIEATRPAHIVELGCGATSLVLARALALHGGGTLHSYDQHEDFSDKTRDWLAEHGLAARMHHAPLMTAPHGWPACWYQLHALPAQIDMLVIDGPSWSLHPYVRGAAEILFPRLSPGAIILLDDALRPGERAIARRWAKSWPDIHFTLDKRGTKGTLVGIKNAGAGQAALHS